MAEQDHADLTQLHQAILAQYDREELRTLCFVKLSLLIRASFWVAA
jgi:hypothetical protein